MAPELHPVLKAWLEANPGKGYDPLLHHGPDRRPFARGTLESWARQWGTDAKVADCHPHRFWHTYATDLLRKGVPIQVVQKLLGHTSIATTMVYTNIVDASLLKTVLMRSANTSQPETNGHRVVGRANQRAPPFRR